MFIFARFLFFLKYFKRKKTLYVLLQWKRSIYGKKMFESIRTKMQLSWSKVSKRIFYMILIIVEQMCLKTIFNPDFMFRYYLPCLLFKFHLWCHFSFWLIGITLFVWKLYNVWFLFHSTNSILILFSWTTNCLISG